MIPRIIARLDIKGPNLVKGISLEGLRALGPPDQYAKYYFESGADELIYMDVVASLYGRNSLIDVISRTARDVYIPLTVGGGIRTLDDINAVLRAGADKVCINTGAINNPELIRQASRKFGSSTIVVAIEAIEQDDGSYLAFIDNGRQHTGLEVEAWALRAQDLGAGELVLTSVDREGAGRGLDLSLIQRLAEKLDIPLVAHGGVGKAAHVVDLFQKTSASAVAIASLFHYDFLKTQSVKLLEGEEGNLDFVKSGRGFSRIETSSISELKQTLINNQIECRWPIAGGPLT